MSNLYGNSNAVRLVKSCQRSVIKGAVRLGAMRVRDLFIAPARMILTFHHVRRERVPGISFDSCPSVWLDTFREILVYLKQHYAVVSLHDLCDGRFEKERAVTVTFDDGWRDNYELAFPVLRELGIPATIFVTTGKIGSTEVFWQQILGHAFQEAAACPAGDVARRLKTVLGEGDATRIDFATFARTVTLWKTFGDDARDACLRQAVGEQAIDAHPTRHFLNAEEIREMAQNGITFGAHTVNHAILPQIPIDEARRELAECKATLEGLVGGTVDTLAYPDGKYNAAVLEAARSLGYRIGCTTENVRISAQEDLLRLPRFELSWSGAEDLGPFSAELFQWETKKGRTGRRPCAPEQKIKILFLVDDWCGPEGGTEQHMLFLQRELPRAQYDLHFAVLSRLQRSTPDDFPVRPITLNSGAFAGRRRALMRVRQLARLIRELEIDVVHAFCRTSELNGLLAVKMAHRAQVLGVRRNLGYWHTARTRWIARLVSAMGAQYAANCEAARDFAADVEWISRRRVCVIRNPAPSTRLEQGLAAVGPRSALGILDGEQVVCIVATVRPIKDYETFLRAARLVIDERPRTRFLVIGVEEPDYAEQMRQLARELKINRQVSWLGPIANPLSILPHVDVAVLSSLSEALSNSLIEYAAAGKPAVATDVGGAREAIVDGETGFIVPPRAAEAMAERIGRLLGDESLRRRMGQAAQRRSTALFSERAVLSEYAELYARLAHKARTFIVEATT